MDILGKVKSNLKKFVPSALKKRFGMAHRKHRHGHARRRR
jgi:hypothetical protein